MMTSGYMAVLATQPQDLHYTRPTVVHQIGPSGGNTDDDKHTVVYQFTPRKQAA